MNEIQDKNLIERFIKPLFVRSVEYKPVQSPDFTKPLNTYRLQNRDTEFTDADLDELGHILYGEISNRSDEGKQGLERQVITNTAFNRMQEYKMHSGKNYSLADVLRMPNQYQAYLPDGIKNADGTTTESQYQMSKNKKIDAVSKKKYDDTRAFIESLKKGDIQDNTNGAFYYVHKDDGSIEYDDTRPLFAK